MALLFVDSVEAYLSYQASEERLMHCSLMALENHVQSVTMATKYAKSVLELAIYFPGKNQQDNTDSMHP